MPFTSVPQDNEIIKFPITGGGNTLVGTTEKRVGDLKEMLSSKVEPDNPEVIEEAGLAAGKYSGDYTVEQVSAIYAHLKENWHYLRDPRGFDYFKNASSSLKRGFNQFRKVYCNPCSSRSRYFLFAISFVIYATMNNEL